MNMRITVPVGAENLSPFLRQSAIMPITAKMIGQKTDLLLTDDSIRCLA
jgi:hypothetical protein